MDIQFRGETRTLEPIKFKDITPGMMIAHYVEDAANLDLLWIGLVDTIGSTGHEVYGGERSYMDRVSAWEDSPAGQWSGATHSVGKDLVIAADWHETEKDHKLFRFV